jgi:hypothetical protein
VQVNLNQIKEASQCLRYYNFLSKGERKPKDELLYVIEKVIQKAHLQALNTKFRSEWRKIVGWVDQLLVANTNILNDQQWEKIRQDSEFCLNFLSSWYKNIYMQEHVIAFGDFALKHTFPGIEIIGHIPIIKAFDVPVVMIVSDTIYNEWSLYNDISARGLAWLASLSLDSQSIGIESISPGKQGGFNHTKIVIDKTGLERTGKMIEEIAGLLVMKIDFPSVTNSCSNCPFKRRCII